MKLATFEVCVNSDVIQPRLNYDIMIQDGNRRMFVEAVAVRVNVAVNIRLKNWGKTQKSSTDIAGCCSIFELGISWMWSTWTTCVLKQIIFVVWRAGRIQWSESRAAIIQLYKACSFRGVHRLEQRGAAVMATRHLHATQIIIGLNKQVARYARSLAGSTLLCNNKSNTWRQLHCLLESVCASDVWWIGGDLKVGEKLAYWHTSQIPHFWLVRKNVNPRFCAFIEFSLSVFPWYRFSPC
jgi:hypothetical protein